MMYMSCFFFLGEVSNRHLPIPALTLVPGVEKGGGVSGRLLVRKTGDSRRSSAQICLAVGVGPDSQRCLPLPRGQVGRVPVAGEHRPTRTARPMVALACNHPNACATGKGAAWVTPGATAQSSLARWARPMSGPQAFETRRPITPESTTESLQLVARLSSPHSPAPPPNCTPCSTLRGQSLKVARHLELLGGVPAALVKRDIIRRTVEDDLVTSPPAGLVS